MQIHLFTKKQIKMARRFWKRNHIKILRAREKINKNSKDRYLLKRARWSLKILNWAKQKQLI
jgi:hypothetical protein